MSHAIYLDGEDQHSCGRAPLRASTLQSDTVNHDAAIDIGSSSRRIPLYVPAYRTSSGDVGPALLGGKGAALARIEQTGMRTPEWFAVTTHAFADLFEPATRTGSPEKVREAIEGTPLPESLRSGIDEAINRLNLAEAFLAVRSSAVGEDAKESSHAGQLESFLFVRPEEIESYIRRVWLSAYAPRVIAYRERNRLSALAPGVAVIVQRMIDAEVSGVAFGADPITGDPESIVVSAVYGLGEGLVSGDLNADRYVVRGNEISQDIVSKEEAVRFDPDRGSGTAIVPVAEPLHHLTALDRDRVLEIADAVRKLNDLFGAPQDVEWCISEDRLSILQSRPITGIAIDRGTRRIWDNSNIIESYSGVTTPLTFSFIESVYTEVYKELTRVLGVTDETINENANVFSMLGLIRGRVYYNLLNWYRLLALLPGYRINAAFMEGMMGVRERIEERPDVVPPRGNPWLRLGISTFHLVRELRRLKREIPRFQNHLNATLAPFEGVELHVDSPEDAVVHYRTLERELLQRWRTPILNDFYTMIFHGLLRKMVEKLGIEGGESLHNDLLSGQGEVISTEPIRRMRAIAAAINANPQLRDTVLNEPDPVAFRAMAESGEAGEIVASYLRTFGDRYPGELRLETITPSLEPTLIIGMIRGHLRSAMDGALGEEGGARKLSEEAERAVLERMKGNPLRRLLFRRVLDMARERVRQRENLRFERTRVFAVVRRIFLALGEWFVRHDLLDDKRDIFHLRIDEIFSWIDGTAVAIELRPVIEARRREFAGYAADPSPPDRFETIGAVATSRIISTSPPAAANEEGILRGTACCPGIVRAPIRIVTDPASAPDLRGCIMVAERTDPGWTPLFPLAAGILVERGSLLSHSAIVAREMGIPAVVAIPHLLRELRDGEIVEMNGGAGTIRLMRNSEGGVRNDSIADLGLEIAD